MDKCDDWHCWNYECVSCPLYAAKLIFEAREKYEIGGGTYGV